MRGYTRWIIAVVGIAVLALAFFVVRNSTKVEPIPEATNVLQEPYPVRTVIGISAGGRKIESYTYGKGPTHLLFVGGIHGGYEWNTVVLAYKFLDYLEDNPEALPGDITVTVIPSANPDGVYKITGKNGRITSGDIPKGIDTAPGRFNGNNVDLNRNFDCKWQPKSTWKTKVVSGGTAAFSEPESVAIRDFVLKDKSVAVIFWHSQGGNVYASRCEDGTLPETLDIMKAYAKASGYAPVEKFSAYATTGDADGWLASIKIPAITVELATHTEVEWEKNLLGIKSMLEYYRK